jgi:HEPN domain-containing protein
MTDPDLRREVDEWLRYARDDLEVAELVIEQGSVPRAACFHAQQAAEKAIKACLLLLQEGVPRTHDLELLAATLPEGWRLRENPSSLTDLSGWAVEPRYPGDLLDATKEEAQALVEQARNVYETALKDLEEHGHEVQDEEPQDESAGEQTS